jgi:hypothetical protein
MAEPSGCNICDSIRINHCADFYAWFHGTASGMVVKAEGADKVLKYEVIRALLAEMAASKYPVPISVLDYGPYHG